MLDSAWFLSLGEGLALDDWDLCMRLLRVDGLGPHDVGRRPYPSLQILGLDMR